MPNLKRIADLYGTLTSEAEKVPVLFNKLLHESEAFVEKTQAASRALRDASSASLFEKGKKLARAGDLIGIASSSLPPMSDDLKLVGEHHKRIQSLLAEISKEIAS